jgi:hypothetical protein
LASAPKPVETPYTGLPEASIESTMARLRAIAATVAAAISTGALSRATARTSAEVTPVG